MGRRITFRLLMTLWLGTIGLDCARPLPDPLHCLSRLSFVNKALQSTDYLKVDEYLDVKASRTSIGIYNAREDSTEIHYNKLNSKDLSGRRSVLFNPSDLSCKLCEVSSWQLAEVRRVAVNFYKSKDLGEKFVDVPIGPSLLLYTVQAYTDRFKFVKSVVSKSLMSNVNVYTVQIQGVPASSIFRNLLIVLHVSTEGQKRALKPGDSLKEALLEGSHLDVKFFGVCQLEIKVRTAKRPKKGPDEAATGQNDFWGEDDFCSPEMKRSLLFKIHYDIIEEYKIGTLIGKELDEFGRDELDFAHEPFLQPVGIGCWGLGVNVGSLVERSESGGVLVSASYKTSNGLKGISYVAFDEIGQVLRLDREGRKSIYDLARGQSYHVGQQRSSSSLGSALASGLAAEKCIVLGNDAVSSPINGAGDIMLQLFGLGPSSGHYLGTRTVEHEQYEVYENSFKDFDEEAPILLRTKLDGPSKSQEKMTHFVTYYVQPNRSLRFIELYSFDAQLRRRKLVNRLEFVQFSWSLGVEPEGDPQSEASDSNLRLFQMESCLQNGASQSQLVTTFEDFEDGRIKLEQAAKSLNHYKQELSDSVQRKLAETLRVSVMNIVDLKLDLSSFVRSGKLLATSRVADLRTGVAKFQSLGTTNVIDDGHLLQRNELRFSFEECVLDSLEYPKANRFAHCPQLAACLLFEEGAKVEFELKPDEPGRSNGDGPCHVYTLKYASSDRNGGASNEAEINHRYLTGERLTFHVGPYEDERTGQRWPAFTYTASIHLRDFVRLDLVGARQIGKDTDDLDVLSGLRYTTMGEEALAHNLNVRVAMGRQMNDVDRLSLFTHCQLSCQLDEFCASFSMCYKSKGPNPSDCVLSTLRLTGERVDKILNGASQIRDGETRFQVNITSELSSQVFYFHRDDACSLHPREFALDYQLLRSVERVHEHGRTIEEMEAETQKLETLRAREQMSFEDCAGLSSERTFGCETIRQTNFTYCPLDSLCLVNGDEVEEQLELASGPCRTYQLHAKRFYSVVRSSHMRVVGVKETSSSDQTLVGESADSKDANKLAHLVKSFGGVSEGDCARACNLHKSECLAFDSCRNQGKTLCILFSVRSCLSGRGAYLPLLEREKALAEAGVTMVLNPVCDHFYLKPANFEVRLKNLLARQTSDTTSSGGKEFFPEDVKALEDKLEAYDEEQGKQDLLAVTDHKPDVNNYEHAGFHSEGTSTSSGSLIHWWPLTIGLLLGCILTAYKQEITQVATVVYGLVRPETPTVTVR